MTLMLEMGLGVPFSILNQYSIFNQIFNQFDKENTMV